MLREIEHQRETVWKKNVLPPLLYKISGKLKNFKFIKFNNIPFFFFLCQKQADVLNVFKILCTLIPGKKITSTAKVEQLLKHQNS